VQWQHAGRAGAAAAVLAAAALWGSTGTVAHFAPAAASPVSVGAARIVAAGALLAVIALVSRGPGAAAGSRRGDELRRLLSGSAGRRVILAAGAVSVAGYQLCFFSAVRLTGVAIGTVVAIGSAPVLTGLISRIVGGAALTPRWAAATAGAIAGCVVLVTSGQAAGVNLAGVILALLAGLCYASYAVAAARLITGGYSGRAVMGALFAGSGILLIPVFLASSPGWLLTGRGLAVTAELAVLATVAAYLLYARSDDRACAGRGGPGTGRARGSRAAGARGSRRAADRCGCRRAAAGLPGAGDSVHPAARLIWSRQGRRYSAALQ
jgi:DME family drug/metabolite transporter